MEKYYVNDNELKDGNYEIHTATCAQLPNPYDLTFLGEFSHTKFAIAEAKKMNYNPIPCKHCGLNYEI